MSDGEPNAQERVRTKEGPTREWQMYRTLAGIAASSLIALMSASPSSADYLTPPPAEIDETVIVRRPPVVHETVVVRPAPVVREVVVVRPAPVVREVVVVRPAPVMRRTVVVEPMHGYAQAYPPYRRHYYRWRHHW
jgi:hypothetical protein